jgi:hypothetical protein
MSVYYRPTGTTKIAYRPDDRKLGEQAAKAIVGEVGATVSEAEAADIRAEYERLHADKYGSDSPYYDGGSE